ncbi:MAG: hemerythrin domain-containing protein [Burkholderiaceae bacterium]|jgi:hemerythrin superfamily protein|nr:hemerythrin domain-containing protein [Burkholderiaceae bacterium]MEB2319168.1 hemerythrin domain-containing protein [Pseudomonadota bacterium]
MPQHPISESLFRDHRLCELALQGLDDWLASGSPIVRHPLAACSIALLRHIDTEENVLFPRLRSACPEIEADLDRLGKDHELFRDQLWRIDTLVHAEERDEARRLIAELRRVLLAHNQVEETIVFPHIAEALPDPEEVVRLFGGGHFRMIPQAA